jgi:hypothetical protein
MALSVDALGSIGFLDGIAAAGDDRQGTFVLDLLAGFLAVVGLVGTDGERRPWRVENLLHDLTLVDLTVYHRAVQRAALGVDRRVDLDRRAATADADRLIPFPLFAPLAARWTFTIVLSIRQRLSRDCDANALNICFQMPHRDRRLKRS